MEEARDLAAALIVGLLAGLERAWKQRQEREGGRVAGLRTFGLIGLCGGACAVLAARHGAAVLAAGLLATGWLLSAGYRASAKASGDLGQTTEVSALLVFALGALAASGLRAEAAAAAVVTAALLASKSSLHSWVARIGEEDLKAAVKLLVITVAVLPFLPDRGYGPWGSLNPFELWWMAALIASISFAGYVSIRLLGSRPGAALASFLGGLVSSTAVTLELARRDRSSPGSPRLHAGGIVLASSVMFPRALLEAFLLSPAVAGAAAAPLLAAGLAGLAAAGLLLGRAGSRESAEVPRVGNPLRLAPAFRFAALLAAIRLGAAGLQELAGDQGILYAAAAAGLADVDAITLSAARLARDGLDPETAAAAVLLACAVNTTVKAALAATVAGRGAAWRAAAGLAAALAAGAAAWAAR